MGVLSEQVRTRTLRTHVQAHLHPQQLLPSPPGSVACYERPWLLGLPGTIRSVGIAVGRVIPAPLQCATGTTLHTGLHREATLLQIPYSYDVHGSAIRIITLY